VTDIAPCRVVEATNSDAELTAAAVGGDERAFDELYRRHNAAALRVARATVRNPDDARDAVGEAFARVFRNLAEARSFRPYLLATVRNCALDIVRREERRGRAEAVEQADEADERQPVDRVLADEDERIVVQAFSQLPERWQRALWLIDVEERSTQEAGSALGVSANNAAQLASRARLRLREHYLQAHVPNHIGWHLWGASWPARPHRGPGRRSRRTCSRVASARGAWPSCGTSGACCGGLSCRYPSFGRRAAGAGDGWPVGSTGCWDRCRARRRDGRWFPCCPTSRRRRPSSNGSWPARPLPCWPPA
jgi:RNA polymerase sigma factor (sigma-70 family)